ncbi:UNKNOWN [Stylonychia lemnae]|uniref:Transmembrane protein n=1 Tax=Stylonychia lemnae TaxID=5949 RepID=A0A078BE57_STYLE|nr:UNKNOWN [Stylonychia lemnae]|eukprot:CDW91848.1 UNKNOWN [Stylonychia lemnae]
MSQQQKQLEEYRKKQEEKFKLKQEQAATQPSLLKTGSQLSNNSAANVDHKGQEKEMYDLNQSLNKDDQETGDIELKTIKSMQVLNNGNFGENDEEAREFKKKKMNAFIGSYDNLAYAQQREESQFQRIKLQQDHPISILKAPDHHKHRAVMIDEEQNNVHFLITDNRSRHNDDRSSQQSRRVISKINKTRSIASSNRSVRSVMSKHSTHSLRDKDGEHAEPLIENLSQLTFQNNNRNSISEINVHDEMDDRNSYRLCCFKERRIHKRYIYIGLITLLLLAAYLIIVFLYFL